MVEMLVSGTVVFLVDQVAKRAVESRAGSALHYGPIAIRHVSCRRSFYTRAPVRAALVVVWIAALVSATVLILTDSLGGNLALVALGGALGGAASNLLDILRDQSVRDYIDLGWWPVFNVADVAIVAGLGLAFIPL